jgi:type II secretory pathway pseudopilin PulG
MRQRQSTVLKSTSLSPKGFTLLEVLFSAVVVVLISTATWLGTTALMRSAEIARNRSIALNLLQKSQEELKRVSQTFYDQLENCQFPQGDPPGTGNSCGLSQLNENFSGFSRSLVVANPEGEELKQATITVTWNEFAKPKLLDSVVYISRPPDPLPGNITGVVHPLGNQEQLIDGAQITIIRDGSSESSATTSLNALNSKNGNFDFAEAGSGRFLLHSGSWQLRATKTGYYDYTHPGPIIVESNQEVYVEFAMEPKPDNATIHVTIVDSTKGRQPVVTFSRAFASLFDDTGLQTRVNNQRNFSFTVSFSNSDERCLTINTNDAFKAGYAGSPSCAYLFHKEGWSSAVTDMSQSLNCTNPWNGNASTDRICVDPGDDQSLEIPLVPVPEVLISGRVIDSLGRPVANATVYAGWPRSDSDYWRKGGVIQTATTDSNGRFTNFSVPAVQGLFPNTNPYNNYLRVWASGAVPILSCCDIVQNETRTSQTIEVGPLFPGDPTRNVADLQIPTSDRVCGNVSGDVINDLNKSGVSGANITIVQTEPTNSVGYYQFQCAPTQTGFRLPVGSQQFRARRNGYYENLSSGNSWYAGRSSVQVLANQAIEYDAKMWPQGYGTVRGTVRDRGTGKPIPNADIVLTLYDGSRYNAQTTSLGTFQFNQIIETWPPPALPVSDPYYRHQSLSHGLNVTHNSGIYLPHSQSISQLTSGQTLDLDIQLSTQGNM